MGVNEHETIQHITQKQTKVKEQLVVRMDNKGNNKITELRTIL